MQKSLTFLVCQGFRGKNGPKIPQIGPKIDFCLTIVKVSAGEKVNLKMSFRISRPK
jgi:hypothetical protein